MRGSIKFLKDRSQPDQWFLMISELSVFIEKQAEDPSHLREGMNAVNSAVK